MRVLRRSPSTCNDSHFLWQPDLFIICVLTPHGGGEQGSSQGAISVRKECLGHAKHSKAPQRTPPQMKCWMLEGHKSRAKSPEQTPMDQLKLQHNSGAEIHAVTNCTQASSPQTECLGLVLMSVPGSSWSWNAVDRPTEPRIILIEIRVSEQAETILDRYCACPGSCQVFKYTVCIHHFMSEDLVENLSQLKCFILLIFGGPCHFSILRQCSGVLTFLWGQLVYSVMAKNNLK